MPLTTRSIPRPVRALDVDRLEDSLDAIDCWSLPSQWGQTGAHHGYRRAVRPPSLAWAVEAFEPVETWQVTWTEPGGFIAPHVDPGPWWERWQIPIYPAGRLVVDGTDVRQRPGQPVRVEHHRPHWLANPTDRPRIAIVIDRAVLREGGGGFQRLDMVPDIEALIANIRE